MKVILLILGILAFGLSFANAQQHDKLCITTNGTNCVDTTQSFPYPQRSGSYGITTPPQYCQITSLSSATKLATANCSTGTILANATIAQICVSGQAVRYTSTGVIVPTASVGIPVLASTCFQYSGPITTMQFIQQVSGAILDIETFP